MFNITVIKLKDIVKFFGLLVIVIIVFLAAKGSFLNKDFLKINFNIGEKFSDFLYNHITVPINTQIPVVSKINGLAYKNDINKEGNLKRSFFNNLINNQLGIVDKMMNYNYENSSLSIAASDENNIDEEIIDDVSIESENISDIENKELSTEVVTKNPLVDKYTNNYNSVKIKNESKIELTDDILNFNGLNVNNKNVIIFHTHTCESYTSSEQYSYTSTGNFRTTDLNYTVARVGDELTKYLQNYGVNVIHDKTYHDYPSYSGSYTRSLSTVSKILENNKADIIIDLHRDAIGSYSSYAPSVKIGDDLCAQLMFVMGTNGGGLKHPDWEQNIKWAVSIQQKANEKYPGLFKTMIVRNSRYNQHLGKAACIIEVGATGNTLDQCLNSMKYLAEILNK